MEIEFEGEQSINISGGIFKNSVNIFSANPVKPKYDSRNQSPSLNISGGEFFSNLKVFQGEFLDLGFSGGEFHADCEFTSIVIHNRMGIGSTKFNSKLILNDGEIREIEFYLEKIDFEVLIDCHFVGLLKFDTVIESSGSVLIKKLALNQLYIKDLINYGRFIIQGLKYFEHPYVINYGERNAITNLSGDFPDEKQFESRIHFENSSLGELLFINVDFSSFNEIISENSKVGNISTYGGHFPTKKKHSFLLKNGVLKDEKEEKPDFNLAEQNSEFYNQLYLAMQKQGHRAKEMDYYAEYMEWHRLFLKQEKKEINTRVSLCLNKWSSNYGQDWIRSALITLFIGWLFYFLYIISLPVVTICPTKFNWPDFWFFFGEYWSFLNPVHKVDFIEGLKPGPASKTWDFAGRIFISILIYQTVTAFRRFGRK